MQRLKAILFLLAALTCLEFTLAVPEKFECLAKDKPVGICAANKPSRHHYQRRNQSEILPAHQPEPEHLLIYRCDKNSDIQWCCPTNKFAFYEPPTSMIVDTSTLDEHCHKGKVI
ncbi:hypothetical protein PtA15_8A362 [Puccinia triticina]|uniref:CLIP domain-containing serine protease n=1 Tax=Puccinia triticina TaxID=208348 RepID=A0ABY7CQC8_9BASI|nr:uncharacterized protein PtA15_8A362 [Puccinia triticina]WAQ87458.1 hypothetical protein PtA15_8A362 [Puccinia triticina]